MTAQTHGGRMGRVGVGLIGAGMISDTYLDNLTSFPDVEVVVVGDLDAGRAKAQAEKHGVPGWGTPDDVLAHPDVELVVNLTIPAVHAEVSSAAIGAGRHVWSEKPIGIDRESARQLLDDAARAGLLVGVAPDTLLGPGFQTVRRAIERGDIGAPLAARTVFEYPGPDLFHPNPEFLFAAGAGPLFDVGPYYLTALAQVFGSFTSVSAVGTRSRATRTIQVGERAGTEFPVVAPSTVSAVAAFAGGGIAQSLLSFDSPLARMGYVEITGTEATLLVPDPNTFGGEVRLTRPATLANLQAEPEWISLPVPAETFSRGAGALDLARCVRTGGTPVASGELGYHILDVMASMEESIATGRTVPIASTTSPVPLLPEGWNPKEATL
ncbi:MAG: Gfo/Idh/MocA family oxidoreductase [Propionicimonas sp.]|uniref:Gfo/Idh/MocA family protein n=1 Tax=Propionicimonas sp. TaxID=1955623 RepID=UPI003D130188